MRGVYNIPAGRPFLRTFVRGLIESEKNEGFALEKAKILLPTRRACRLMQDIYLEERGGGAVLMPELQPIADVDEEELSLRLAGAGHVLSLPPTLSAERRTLIMAKLICARDDFEQGYDQALQLAKTLGVLIDQIYTENLKLSDLHTLAPESLAEHWQITIEFLKIISEHWPKI